MHYLALIADICGSRKVAARDELQRTLKSALDDANQRHRKALASPLTITLGDEFQALFVHAEPLWEFIFGLQVRLRPVQLRFGLGLGPLDTPVNTQAALGMDGPAFHRARKAVDILKKEGGFYRVEGISNPALINGSLALTAKLQNSWHDNRFAVYHDYLKDLPVPQTAKALGISKTAVYKNINEGLLHDLASIHRAISQQLSAAMLSA